MRFCEVWQLGHVPYADAWALQNELSEARSAGDSMDRLLLLEHPHTYTLGTSGHDEYILISPAERERLGITLFHTDRGGDVTYHGPGQIVGYPIVQLPRDHELRTNVVGYVRGLEQVIIRTLAEYNIVAKPISGLTGVWVDTPRGEEKIAAIGVRVNVKAVTKHGFALNVNPDLRYFDGIIPCGIRDKGVTSMAALLGAQIDEVDVRHKIIMHFGAVFGYTMVETSPAWRQA
jgi:lipoyl(octanoyl) transferase